MRRRRGGRYTYIYVCVSAFSAYSRGYLGYNLKLLVRRASRTPSRDIAGAINAFFGKTMQVGDRRRAPFHSAFRIRRVNPRAAGLDEWTVTLGRSLPKCGTTPHAPASSYGGYTKRPLLLRRSVRPSVLSTLQLPTACTRRRVYIICVYEGKILYIVPMYKGAMPKSRERTDDIFRKCKAVAAAIENHFYGFKLFKTLWTF